MVLKATLEKKFLNNHFLNSFQKQAYAKIFFQNMFFKIDVQKLSQYPQKTSVLESLFNKVSGLTETLAQVFSCEYCKIFTNSFCYRSPPVASVDLLFLIKNDVGWSLLKKFVDLVRVRYL